MRGTIAYGCDAANQLTTLTDWASHVFTYIFTADGMPSTISRPGAVATSYGYDGADRLTSVHPDAPSGAIAHYEYTLDPSGNRTSMSTAAGKESYALDALKRLTAVSYPNGDSSVYTYDAAGNRQSSSFNGATTNCTYSASGRLTSAGATALTYDAAGNVTSIGSDISTTAIGRLPSTPRVGCTTLVSTKGGWYPQRRTRGYRCPATGFDGGGCISTW